MSQEIIDRIKAMDSVEDLEETAEADEIVEELEESSSLSDEVEEPEVEEADETELAGSDTDEDGEESYFDINGEEIALSTILEWRDGNLRQSDYTKKTTKVAEEMKAIEAKSAKQEAALSALDRKISELDSFLQEEEASVDWDELADTDPAEYLKQQRKLDAKRKALSEAKASQQEQFNERLSSESAVLIDKMPGWSDNPELMNSEFQAGLDYAKQIGLDISGFSDHRVFMALVHASKFKALDSKKVLTSKKVRNAPKAVKATKGKAKPRATDLEVAKSRLRESGSKADAVAAIRQLYN